MLNANLVNGDNFLCINRFDYSSIYGLGATSMGPDLSDRFNDLRVNFREFAIMGVRIELVPNDRQNVAPAGGV